MFAVQPSPLDRVLDAIGALRTEPLLSVEGAELQEIRTAIDQLEAEFCRRLRCFEAQEGYVADGALSAASWVRWKCRLNGGPAAARVAIGRRLGELPQTQAAFAGGEIHYEHAQLMVRALDESGVEAVREQEPYLVQVARKAPARDLRRVTRYLQSSVNPDGFLDEANANHEKRWLQVSEVGEMVHVDGRLDLEGGAILWTALEAVMGPRQLDDARSAGQRRADALTDLCRKALDAGLPGGKGGQRPHVLIHASEETLRRQAAGELEFGGLVPAETVQRILCDCAATLLDGAAVHPARRTVSPATRRAVVGRDRGCVVDGCDRPFQWCDVHHLKWWSRGGPSTMENSFLLCRRHHRLVHEGRRQLVEGEDGRWELRAPP